MKRGKRWGQGGGDSDTRGFPVDLREVALFHFQNLSNEICVDGLQQEYEPALDRLMNWLYWEFTEGHPALKPDFDAAMSFKFGEVGITDMEKVQRIQMKERLLSRLLALHNIDLGRHQITEVENEPEHWSEGDIDQPEEPPGQGDLDRQTNAG